MGDTPSTGRETTACPLVFGPTDAQSDAIAKSVRQVAVTVGARQQTTGKCHPNIFVIITDDPRPVLDYIRDKLSAATRPALLFATQCHAQLKGAARAWYSTDTRDADGYVHPDTGLRGLPVSGQSLATSGLPHFDGLSNLFRMVVIVVDFNKARGNKVGPLSDYIAMLALAQMQPSPVCDGLLCRNRCPVFGD